MGSTSQMGMTHGMGQTEPFAWSHVGSVAFSWVGLAILISAAVVYLAGSVRWSSEHPDASWSIKRTICFMVGLVIVLDNPFRGQTSIGPEIIAQALTP